MPEEVGAWTEGVLLAEVMTIPEEPTALQPMECGPMNPEGAGHVVRFDPERRAVGGHGRVAGDGGYPAPLQTQGKALDVIAVIRTSLTSSWAAKTNWR